MVNRTFNATPTERLQQSLCLEKTNRATVQDVNRVEHEQMYKIYNDLNQSGGLDEETLCWHNRKAILQPHHEVELPYFHHPKGRLVLV